MFLKKMNFRVIPSFYGFIALALLLLFEILLFSHNSLIGHWFYVCAWWPYIFFIDFLLKRKSGKSLIFDNFREFLALIPWSVFIWLIFEWFNLFLKNWHYIHVISSLPLRWLGYFVSFGTVLPGLFLTYQVLMEYGIIKEISVRPLKNPQRVYPIFIILGIIFLVLPVAYPKYFFPFVWGSFIFLLEPVNHAMGIPSLLREWEKGSFRKFVALLTAGLICGFLWEFWNFWAITKWIYTVPFIGKIKLFEMPVLGFLGFPPFAVECYVMMNFINIFRGGKSWEKEGVYPVRFKLPFLLILLLHVSFYIFMFHQIDLHTVLSYD